MAACTLDSASAEVAPSLVLAESTQVSSDTLTSARVLSRCAATSSLIGEKPFPFMDLPTELRLHVYRMALSRHKPIFLHMSRNSDPESLPWSDQQAAGSFTWDTDSRPLNIGSGASSVKKPADVNEEPIIPALLRVSKQIYREARPVLYSDNEFVLQLDSAIHTLGSLHQRSRSLIKHVRLTIPTHHDILEGFADLVRLGLRYCWGLRTFTIALPYMYPDDRTFSHTTNVYANAFHILRWLPKPCVVKLEGNVHEEIRRVVEENVRLASSLDEKAYLRRQHQMPERH